ncbi:hypothetical protein SEA_GETALONG_91 [Gordonia phage Getalong]|uniref:Helix-turn-helix DNA binding domain protein n=4 Tax=Getalongvirus TaxID=2733156 RepID=A0A3S9UPY2_9CAUD|nr:hypothetical protein HOS44_gp088 [Gordonia phage BENtherdunthat]YP_009814204.1 hypothetical protein HOU38_gp091 [Gordonia phage Getalong]YP_009818699.1 hypothetical protein HOU97_gp83 [Gordonia phage Kenna]QCG77246.1 hypothetical protein SEA_LUTUM_89 [Gordonia phage Lutum]USH45590.1 hypothetical protein SEA_PHABULOSO_95 [Gordonia phage Phabuloso]ATW60858.1 hypothetical protein SEA_BENTHERDUNTHAT_88 [Gordonia phage BENtherdunthat]AYD83951.1 hypothetical protein SEA_GETALONG_91 [Gordonia pha
MAEWFAASSRYYKDLDDMGVSETAQTCFMRILAYIAEQENLDGFIAETALKKLGLRSVSRRVDELIRYSILTPSEDPLGYHVRAFEKWQGPLIAHVRKKLKDRERVAEKRRVADASRDSRTNVATHRTEQNRTTKYVGSSAPVSDARNQPSGPPIQRDAARLVRDHIPDEHPAAVKTALRIKASELIHSGTDPNDVGEALTRWVAKPGIGPGVLPALVSDVVKERSGIAQHTRARPRSTTDERIAAAQALKDPAPNVRPIRGIQA